MWAFADLGINLVAGVAGAPSVLLIGVLGEWVAALDHETLDDTMETGPVVKGFIGEFLKILQYNMTDVENLVTDLWGAVYAKNHTSRDYRNFRKYFPPLYYNLVYEIPEYTVKSLFPNRHLISFFNKNYDRINTNSKNC